MNITAQLEAILFVASKPLTIKKLANTLSASEVEVRDAISVLSERYNHAGSGINILLGADEVQMVTGSAYAELLESFLKSEVMGELTPAQLETLTVVAYQQPVTRPELEQIRGVNCAVILRNLLQRGLVEEQECKDSVLPVYRLSIQALKQLGVQSAQDLPHYAEFHDHEHVHEALKEETES